MMGDKIPEYLHNKSNNVKMILFTALFALLFINLFQPFGSRDWYPDLSDIKYFAYSSLIILTGMLVVVISRTILISYSKKHDILKWHYAICIFCEIIAMSIFYTLFSVLLPKDGLSRETSKYSNKVCLIQHWYSYCLTQYHGYIFHGKRKALY